MDSLESADMYFKNIEELIEDSDKIVTVPYLAMIEHVSMQHSHKIMEQYVETTKEMKPQQIAVAYVLRGLLRDCRRKGIFIVKESSLLAKRNLLEKVDDELIFSIQKSTNIDFDRMSLVDKFDFIGMRENNLMIGAIVGNNCSKREAVEKSLLFPVSETAMNSSVSVPVSAEKTMETSSELVNGNGTADISNKTVIPTSQKKLRKNNYTGENKFKKTNSGISDFFKTIPSKVLSDNGIPSPKVKNTSEPEDTFEESKSREGDNKECSISFMKKCESIEECKTNKHNFGERETKNRKNNKRRRDENLEEGTKRRRRIVERNDSESDDMFEKADENIVDKSDDEPDHVLSPLKNSLVLKNRKRRAIDKTYQDDEGFIVTRTEYIYETASEDEMKVNMEDRKKKDPTENNLSENSREKKEKKNNKQNQPTLMNYFKKK